MDVFLKTMIAYFLKKKKKIERTNYDYFYSVIKSWEI